MYFLKIAGMVLIVLCSSVAGFYKASAVSRKVSQTEKAIALVGFLADTLRYRSPSVRSLVEEACSMALFADCAYLFRARAAMDDGEMFSLAWRNAVEGSAAELGADCAGVLAQLAEILGALDLDSQLSALERVQGLLQNRLESEREKAAPQVKLYRSLGVLAGVAAVIIIA